MSIKALILQHHKDLLEKQTKKILVDYLKLPFKKLLNPMYLLEDNHEETFNPDKIKQAWNLDLADKEDTLLPIIADTLFTNILPSILNSDTFKTYTKKIPESPENLTLALKEVLQATLLGNCMETDASFNTQVEIANSLNNHKWNNPEYYDILLQCIANMFGIHIVVLLNTPRPTETFCSYLPNNFSTFAEDLLFWHFATKKTNFSENAYKLQIRPL